MENAVTTALVEMGTIHAAHNTDTARMEALHKPTNADKQTGIGDKIEHDIASAVKHPETHETYSRHPQKTVESKASYPDHSTSHARQNDMSATCSSQNILKTTSESQDHNLVSLGKTNMVSSTTSLEKTTPILGPTQQPMVRDSAGDGSVG